MNNKFARFDIDDGQLKRRQEELLGLIQYEDDQKLYLLEQENKLERELSNVKKRYIQEQRLKNINKQNLDEINQSRSWKFSLPIRKIGKLFKSKSHRNNNSHVNVLKEILEEHTDARHLDRKLWGGYSSYAYDELKQLKQSPNASINERLRATRSLSRWYYDRHQFDEAYKELEYINEVKPINNPNTDRTITEIKVLKKLGEVDIAKRKVWNVIEAKGLQEELCLSMAYLAEEENEKLNWYNLLYDMYGYNQIKKIDELEELNLENIYTPSKKVNQELEKYKVSVIIPAYNAEDLIHIALDSLLNQTIQNLEIIVVDDCSPDNTADVVARYAEKDNRVKLIKKEKNEGAYAARNTGLQYVTGDFITIHDSDDWSHSQKIEVQLKELLANPKAVGTVSFLVRALKDMTPINGGSLLGSRFLMMNSSSLLIRKRVYDRVGGWDSVRVAGDSEYIWRIEKVFGKETIVRVEPKIPFSIALSNENSLTGTTTTHVKTIMFGLRRTYREAFEWWHNQAINSDDLYMDPEKVNRDFPCPVPNRILQPSIRSYNSILVADFSAESDQKRLISMLEYVKNENSNVGIFHWPDYNANPFNAITDEIHELVNMKEIDILVPNEKIETNSLMVLTPRILNYKLDSVPNVKCNQTFIISDEDMSSENKIKKEENLEQVLGVRAKWYTFEEIKNNHIS